MLYRVSLRCLLIVISILQVGGAVGLVGYFSFQNGKQTVDTLANRLIGEANALTQQQIQQYLQMPRMINRINADAIALGALNGWNPASLSRHFWRTRAVFEPVLISAMYFGTETGEFTGLGFQANGQWQVGRSGPETGGRFYSYGVDQQGTPTALVEAGNPYDPRQRPWYTSAVTVGKPHWSPIYLDFKENRAKITLGQPIYRGNGTLQGVVGADFVLAHVEIFLKQLEIAQRGTVLIVEPSGDMVASSAGTPTFTAQRLAQPQRVNLRQSADPLLRAIAADLDRRFGSFADIDSSQQLRLVWQGQTYFVNLKFLADEFGLNWWIIGVVPESVFMAPIQANTQKTIGLCLAALGLGALSSFVTARGLSRPMQRLGWASRQMAEGEAVPNLPPERIQELDTVATAFNQMSVQMQQSRGQLQDYARGLEQRVQERTAALQASEEKFRTLVSNLPGAIYRCLNDEFWTVEYMSDEILTLTGYPAADLVGNRVRSFADIIHPEDHELVRTTINRGLAQREPYVLEYRMCHADGSDRWVYDKGQGIFDGEGNFLWLDGAVFDISDRKRAELQLIQSEKLAALGQLVASVAHEINTPLGAIHSSVETMDHFFAQELATLPAFLQQLSPAQQQAFFTMLQGVSTLAVGDHLSRREKRRQRRAIAVQLQAQQIDAAEIIADMLVDLGLHDIASLQWIWHSSDPRRVLDQIYQLATVQTSLRTIGQATDRAAKVVSALRSYARQGSMGKPVPTSVTDGIETALTLYQSQLSRGIVVQRHYADLPLIPGFPDELDQVWGNLIHNALQAMPSSGVLTIRTALNDDGIQVDLTDTGPGIPGEIQGQVFEPFFTTKSKGEGSGLGLSIVKKIIDKHQGAVGFTSRPGCTTFTVRLPRSRSEHELGQS
jgi:PAS domain S-box-containing protein